MTHVDINSNRQRDNEQLGYKSPTDRATQVHVGLQDIVALGSRICFIDGESGRLLYHGYDINDLAQYATYEEVVYLLWHGELPSPAELTTHRQELAACINLPQPIIDLIGSFPACTNPMVVLRTAVSALGAYDVEAEKITPQALFERAARLVVQVPIIVATYERVRKGLAPLQPRPDLTIASNFLYMLNGSVPDPELEHMFDSCLILHADHELNASTFVARVTAGTLSDMYSAVTGAIGALKGPLHGGANEQVMEMLLEIGDTEKVEAYVDKAFADKKKIMGFGHRVYKTEDPRAAHLRRFSERMGERTGQMKWFMMSKELERAVLKHKPLYPNVDLYSASTYYNMGIPTDLDTPIFAMSRISGWTAHILEQYMNNRLIRPRAQYVGPALRRYIPVTERAS